MNPRTPTSTTSVKNLMSSDVRSCQPDHTLACAAQCMWEADCGCVPVVDAQRRIVGIVTDRDICMAAYLNNRSPHDLKVGDFMSHQVLVCHPQNRVTDVTATMRRAQVRRLPVTDDDDRLVGIVSLADVARMADGAVESTALASAAFEVGRTLGAVGKPRGRGLPLSG